MKIVIIKKKKKENSNTYVIGLFKGNTLIAVITVGSVNIAVSTGSSTLAYLESYL